MFNVNFWGVKLPRIIEDPRELILSEAKKILENEGYSQISIRRVAKECGIAVGTIYNYFPTKKGLIVEMMTDFWEEYFCDIEPILNSQEGFYIKLKKLFSDLAQFIKRFREIWLHHELYSSPDYIESGLKRKNLYIDQLIGIIEELLVKEVYHKENVKSFNSNNMASFILINFISMVQMPYFDYQFFERILKAVIQ
jgi:AcrR family transcriptional regulator